jgi:DNA-binding GntR family transcriptional regulator
MNITLGGSPLDDLQRSRPANLTEVAAEYICDLIFSARKKPGSRIQPVELAQEIGISSTPVREALVLLAHEGLVTLRPRKGYSVAKLARIDIEDIFALDAHLESILSCRALPHVTDQTVAELEALDKKIRGEVAIGRADQIGHLNGVFHGVLASISPEGSLLRSLRSSTWRSRPMRFYSSIPGFVEATHHDGIIGAVRERNAHRVDEEIRSHAQVSCALLTRHLEATGFFD